MANNDYPVLDGITPSWADVICRATPSSGPLIDMKDIVGISTGISIEVGEQRSGGRLIKTTTGDEKSEATITLYYSGYTKLLRNLKALAPVRGNQRRVSLVHFGFQVQFTPPGSDEIFEIRIKGCRLMGRTLNATEGTDAQQVEVPLNVKQIVDVIDGEEVAFL